MRRLGLGRDGGARDGVVHGVAEVAALARRGLLQRVGGLRGAELHVGALPERHALRRRQAAQPAALAAEIHLHILFSTPKLKSKRYKYLYTRFRNAIPSRYS